MGSAAAPPPVTPAAVKWLDRAAATPARACLWLTLIALFLFLPGFVSMPPLDRDEPRFAQASRQMIETGDAVSIRFQGEARNKKPVGIYWLQAGAVEAARTLGVPDALRTIWIYRLPSLAGAIGAVLLTFWAALAFMSRRYAFIAALLFASTILIGAEARLAKTDAVVTATVVMAMGALARAYLARTESAGVPQRRRSLPFVFWTAIAIGILVKGPITPMVPLLAGLSLALTERWRQAPLGRWKHWVGMLRPGVGLIWCVLLIAPWFVLILVATHGTFFADAVGGDMLGKVASVQELHGAPPGAYLLAFFVAAWPLAPVAILAVPAVWRGWREPAIAVLLAWLVPTWLVFEIVPTKLPHYVLPLYPAIAILAAMALERGALVVRSPLVRAIAVELAALVPLGTTVGAIVLGYFLGLAPGMLSLAMAPIIIIGTVLLVRFLWRALAPPSGADDLIAPIFALVALAVAFEALVFQGLLSSPFFEPFAISPRLVAAAEAARKEGMCDRLSLATVSYREPSLVFLTDTSLLMTDPRGAAAFLEKAPCRAAFVEIQDEAAFRDSLLPDAPIDLAGRVGGIAMNGGKSLNIGVFVRQGSSP
ncbi:MAG: glycosyltransferase family 39 protein [Methylobacteriaceae bacterium]|nr:glycosyltransferase family 39 protein [Methylobacteriaceae bacterium]